MARPEFWRVETEHGDVYVIRGVPLVLQDARGNHTDLVFADNKDRFTAFFKEGNWLSFQPWVTVTCPE